MYVRSLCTICIHFLKLGAPVAPSIFMYVGLGSAIWMNCGDHQHDEENNL